MSDKTSEARAIAAALISESEDMRLRAYPDPMSALGRAMSRVDLLALEKTGEIPAHLANLSGDPWTCGIGATGSDVKRGTMWSRQHAVARFESDLTRFHDMAERIWPGTKNLHPKAQAALISLVYNRGGALQSAHDDPLDWRREMRDLGPVVAQRDYARMADLILSMRRLWEGKGMNGLIHRRNDEAALCRAAMGGELRRVS